MDPTGESDEQAGFMRMNVTVLVNGDEMASHKDGDDTAESFGIKNGITEFRDVLMPPHVFQARPSLPPPFPHPPSVSWIPDAELVPELLNHQHTIQAL